MHTFFKICITICLIMLAFSLIANFVSSTGAFPYAENIGTDVEDTNSALQTLTGLENPDMQSIWLGVTSMSLVFAVALSVFTRSVVPIGLALYGTVFWTSWVRMSSIFSYGGYIPGEFLVIFTVGIMFVFIASIIGMLTGSG